MLSRRNFVMMLTMFGVILVLFLSSAVLKEYFNDLLLEDYGLTRNSFIEEKNGINFDSYKVSELKKTLVKKMPNLTITNHIKYL